MAQFRTKARAVDLLGKGQIADLPTAITELWKNGYDAYADTLTAEIFLENYKGLDKPMFMITDDGKGMSETDIFDKWLILGTDSKSRVHNVDTEGADTLWKKPRIKSGEKGIGRLSVAFLGSPMLMLTKKQGYPLQALFFNWQLLENYNLFLDDIQIPVADLRENDSFSSKFKELQEEFLSNFDKVKDDKGNLIWEDEQLGLKDRIINSVNSIKLPSFFEEQILSDIITINDHGTKFVIFEPDQQILDLLTENADSDDNDSDFVRSSLSGFVNPFVEERPLIKTLFPIHSEIGYDSDFLNQKGNFFRPDDYKLADVIIDGNFDGEGGFVGKVKIYDETIDYNYGASRKKDKRNNYGAYPIKLAYSQGKQVDSKLTESQYEEISKKVTEYGAIYIYRDGFRVLPYGRIDFDFLGLEEKRSKRAGTYFFSYRRMYGYLGLSRKGNPLLKDKSSREGLINNAPYRAFREDLIGLFKDLAYQYFSDKAKQSIFLDKKKLLNEQRQAIKKDAARITEEKKAFSRDLKEYPAKLENYKKEYTGLVNRLRSKITESEVIYSDIEDILRRINKLDIEYKELLPKVPKNYNPTDLQLERLSKYEDQIELFNETVKKQSAELMAEVQLKLQIRELQIEFSNRSIEYKSSLENILNTDYSRLKSQTDKLLSEYKQRSTSKLQEFEFKKKKLSDSIQTKEDVISQLKKLNQTFDFLREQIEKEITPTVNHIEKINFDIDEELLQGAYRNEYENIKYRWEQTRETAQLGIAVEIIDHEFNVLYSQINAIIEKLDDEMVGNTEFSYLKIFFKTLEDKYALLSPLYRVSGVVSKDIECSELHTYVLKFFEKRISQEGIAITSTPRFENHIITIKEPAIHTVFINIINNALYWLRNSETKQILFDYNEDTDEILILNSGPRIEKHRLKKIFELFYSNRPNGRGIGLYLTKQTLIENYFDIYATNDPEYNILNGACFVIKPLADTNDDTE